MNEHENESDGENGTSDAASAETRHEEHNESEPATPREQVYTMLFFIGTFLAVLGAVTIIGLYRNRSQ